MDPQEMLPPPEREHAAESADSFESVNETERAKQVERKSGPVSGFGAVGATAVDDAKSQVSSAVGVSLGTTSTGATTQLDTPMIADDLDLIEKEWVKKAKDIVAMTIGDPYRQNQQISEMKVDYIKKRYNKDIKLRKE